jgi:hypothetical protein
VPGWAVVRNREMKQGSGALLSVWLWRRIPHPDDLVPGGPEIDFGIQTDEVFLLGEAKWRSSVATAQGVSRNKDQITLRREFCQKYGRRLLPGIDRFVILGVSLKGGMVPKADDEIDGASLHIRGTTWEAVAGIKFALIGFELKHKLPEMTFGSHAYLAAELIHSVFRLDYRKRGVCLRQQ